MCPVPWPGDEPTTLGCGYNNALTTELPGQGYTETLEKITYIKVLRIEKRSTSIFREDERHMEEIKQKVTNNYKQTT